MPFPRACPKCGEVHTASGFYIQHGGDGRTRVCKECIKKGVREYRERNIEKVREYDRERGQLEHRKEANRARAHLYSNRPAAPWRAKNIEKYKAHCAVNNAVRDGKMLKPHQCERCGAPPPIHGHHDDYGKPLDVMWLCQPCHGKRHRELNEDRRKMERKAS
jgi:hypothetical protein